MPDVPWSVSVCVLDTRMRRAETDKPIVSRFVDGRWLAWADGSMHYTGCPEIPTFHVPALCRHALLKPLQSGRNPSTLPFLLIIYSNRSQLRPLAPQRICSKLFKWGGSLVDFFIWRFTRYLIFVPAPLNAYTALQLCSDYGLLLLLWRRPGPIATSDICF